MADTPVRMGDRYTHGDLNITVTAVHRDPYLIEYTQLDTRSLAIWSSKLSAIPENWTKVHSAPKPVIRCVACDNVDAEPGQLYCWDCAVLHAAEWAGLSGVDATAKMVSLIEKTEK